MPAFIAYPLACAALSCLPAAIVGGDAQAGNNPTSVETASEAKGVELIAFDGEFEFLKTSSRLRIWRPEVGFELAVDAEGNAIDCEITKAFRRTYVNNKLCKVLMEHHHFEPARNAEADAVPGTYRSRISYMDLRSRQ